MASVVYEDDLYQTDTVCLLEDEKLLNLTVILNQTLNDIKNKNHSSIKDYKDYTEIARTKFHNNEDADSRLNGYYNREDTNILENYTYDLKDDSVPEVSGFRGLGRGRQGLSELPKIIVNNFFSSTNLTRKKDQEFIGNKELANSRDSMSELLAIDNNGNKPKCVSSYDESQKWEVSKDSKNCLGKSKETLEENFELNTNSFRRTVNKPHSLTPLGTSEKNLTAKGVEQFKRKYTYDSISNIGLLRMGMGSQNRLSPKAKDSKRSIITNVYDKHRNSHLSRFRSNSNTTEQFRNQTRQDSGAIVVPLEDSKKRSSISGSVNLKRTSIVRFFFLKIIIVQE